MIVFEPRHLRELVCIAEEAYPEEACGLLVGEIQEPGMCQVTGLSQSPNVAADRRRNFEIDPKLRIDLHRALRDSPYRVIGVYHSHPDQSAQPSVIDLKLAWETELIWVITSVLEGKAVLTTGHILVQDERTIRFKEVPVHTTDWGPYSSRDRISGGGFG